jgi:hypothetical protein
MIGEEGAMARKRSNYYCGGAFVTDMTCGVVLQFRGGIVTGESNIYPELSLL